MSVVLKPLIVESTCRDSSCHSEESLQLFFIFRWCNVL